MPLPFIPLILGAAALTAAGFGVKKGLEAKENFETADSISRSAQSTYDKAKNLLEDTRKETRKTLEELGTQKVTLYSRGIIPFVESFKKIHNLEFTDSDLTSASGLDMTPAEFREIESIALSMADVLGGGVASLGGGALAGIGAFGGAGLFATASTGTAISALSGVAATNATLAWFGGGALAAGGLGMAGGMAVLGGIVAGPVLLVGGMLMASKAEKAVDDALSNMYKAEAAAEAMKTARTAAKAINKRAEEIAGVLEEIKSDFLITVRDFVDLIVKNKDFATYTKEEKALVARSMQFTKTVKNLIEVPVFDEDGKVTAASKKLLKQTNAQLQLIMDA